MDKVDVSLGMADDATEKVLAALPKDVTGHLVRIEIALPDELRNRLDEKRLADRPGRRSIKRSSSSPRTDRRFSPTNSPWDPYALWRTTSTKSSPTPRGP